MTKISFHGPEFITTALFYSNLLIPVLWSVTFCAKMVSSGAKFSLARTFNSKPSYGYLVKEHLNFSAEKRKWIGKPSENWMTLLASVSS